MSPIASDRIKSRDYSQLAIAIPIVLLLAVILLKPVPLVGGFTDDFKYLTGAQCLDCLPTNHWERRFVIVWPTGIAIKLFGQNFWSVMIFPIAAAIAAVLLTFKLVEHQYGRKAGLIACCVLVLTPAFSERTMRVAVDIIELVFLLGSVFVLQRGKGHFWAGALMALAVLCRPTMLAALPMVGFLAWWQDPKRIKWFALGFVVPLAAEALVYLVATGDALYPWKLSLNHQQFSRAALDDARYVEFMSPSVDTSQSPFFNPDFIGGWKPIAKIDAHWTVQGIVNLLASPECALTLGAALVFALLAWKHLDKLQVALIVSAALFFGALTYAFAVDPRPRMFLPIIVIASTLIGALAAKLWVWPRKLVVVTFLSLIFIVGGVKAATRFDYRDAAKDADKLLAVKPYLVTTDTRERMALIRQRFPVGGRDLIDIDDRCPPLQQGRWLALREGRLCIYGGPGYPKDHQRIQMIISPIPDWIAAHPGQIEIDPDTRRFRAAVPGVRDLPGLGSGRRFLLMYGTNSCRAWLARNGLQPGEFTLVEEESVSRTPFLGDEWAGSLCLFKYTKPVPAGVVQAAILQARGDKLYSTEPRMTFDRLRAPGLPLLLAKQSEICRL